MKRQLIKSLFGNPETGREVTVMGWVRTKRGNKNVVFIAINDGSTLHNMQAVVNPNDFDETLLKNITTGSALSVTGILTESKGQEQPVEIQARKIELFGTADAEKYPLQKKGHTLEFLREIAHLRPRTNTFGAIFRIRHALAFAIHRFFNERNFFYVHTPIITASDAEGAGEMFRVTTSRQKKKAAHSRWKNKF
jgi:Aspartyl/asparaginyl-tRNA synthetases